MFSAALLGLGVVIGALASKGNGETHLSDPNWNPLYD